MAKTIADAFHAAEVTREVKNLLEAQRAEIEEQDEQLRPWVIHFAKFEELYGWPEDPLGILRRLPYRVATGSTASMPSLFTEEGVGEAILSLCERSPDKVPWDELSADDLIFGWGRKLALKVKAEWRPPMVLSLDGYRGDWDSPDNDPLGWMDVRHVEPLGIPVPEETTTLFARSIANEKDVPRSGRLWTRPVIAETFRRFFDEHGRAPRGGAQSPDKKIAPYLPSGTIVLKNFPSWADACAYAGLRAVNAGQRTRSWGQLEAAIALDEYAKQLGYFPSRHMLDTQASRTGGRSTAPTGPAIKRLMGRGRLGPSPTPAEMQEWVAKTLREAEQTPQAPAERDPPVDLQITFGEWFDIWSTTAWHQEPAANTRGRYIALVKRYGLAKFRSERLHQVDAWKVRRLLVEVRDREPYRRVPEIKSALASFLAEAVAREKLATNDAKRVKAPMPLAPPVPPPTEGDPEVTTPAEVLKALNGRMTGVQVAQRLGETTRDVLPLLNSLYAEGKVDRLVSADGHARFSPAEEPIVPRQPIGFSSMSVEEEKRRTRGPVLRPRPAVAA